MFRLRTAIVVLYFTIVDDDNFFFVQLTMVIPFLGDKMVSAILEALTLAFTVASAQYVVGHPCFVHR